MDDIYLALLTFVFLFVSFCHFMKPTVIFSSGSSSSANPNSFNHASMIGILLNGPLKNREEYYSKESSLQVYFSWKRIFYWILIFPVVGLWICLLISILFDFESSTSTHCGKATPNFFPSISSCIGGHQPQRAIWTFCICFYIQQRILAGFVLSKSLMVFVEESQTISVNQLNLLNNTRLYINTIEQVSLALLTIITSGDWKFFHQLSFGVFWICSLINMYLTVKLSHHKLDRIENHFKGSKIDLESVSSISSNPTRKKLLDEDAAYKLRLQSAMVHYSASLSAITWYVIHNLTCGKYFYSYFAIAEWIVVFSNISFHSAEAIEAHEGNIVTVFLLDIVKPRD